LTKHPVLIPSSADAVQPGWALPRRTPPKSGSRVLVWSGHAFTEFERHRVDAARLLARRLPSAGSGRRVVLVRRMADVHRRTWSLLELLLLLLLVPSGRRGRTRCETSRAVGRMFNTAVDLPIAAQLRITVLTLGIDHPPPLNARRKPSVRPSVLCRRLPSPNNSSETCGERCGRPGPAPAETSPSHRCQ
jgi:hypothetical protein